MAPVPRSKQGKRRGKPGPPRAALRAVAAAASASSAPAPASSTPPSTGKRRAEREATRGEEEPDTELVFEDPYGDEFEEEEVSVDQKVSADAPPIVDPMVVNDAVVFRPGRDKLAEGEQLVCDESAYDVFHKCMVEWPAMSFDFVCTNAAGEYDNVNPVAADTYPLSVSMVLGTQADRSNKNKLVCVRMSNMHRTGKKSRKRTTKEHDSDSESSEEENDDGDEEEEGIVHPDKNAVLQSADIRVDSTVNRVRVMPQRSNIVAVWTESGRVSLVDASPALDTLFLDRRRMQMPNTKPPSSVKPFSTFNGHGVEGYALDWSRASPGRLLSGSCRGGIYLSEPASAEGSAWKTSPNRFRGHSGSVEDIQWSPNEANVFASCSTDKSIRFWDAREYRRPALGVGKAHDADVNVISWNRNETHLVVSGGDDGMIRVWDLRALDRKGDNPEAKPAAEFKHHQKPITGIQWHPRDSSMLCASSEDGTVSVWDLAVERDAEEELQEGVVLSGAEEFPPQLLFIHMGQNNVKEVQWHPACTSLVVSTAADGLNLFQPSNITLPA